MKQAAAWLDLHVLVVVVVVVVDVLLVKSREKQITSADWLTARSVGVVQLCEP